MTAIPSLFTRRVTASYFFFAVFFAAFLAFFAIRLFPPFIWVYGAESHHRSPSDCPWARRQESRCSLLTFGCGPRTRETARGM
jgi:hypothetical protein